MIRIRTALATVAILIAVGVIGAVGAPAAAGGAPKIVDVEFYEDLEDGYRYNIDAALKGAEKVTARSGSIRTNGRLSQHIGTTGPGKVWFFRERKFVKRVKADLYADGFATLIVKATNGDGSVRKLCELNLEPDAQFGDYASGDCDKV